MNYEKEPLHISTSVPNGTYEVTVTVTAHEDIIFTILSQSRRFMAQDINLGKGESSDITFNVSVCDYHKNNEDYTILPHFPQYRLSIFRQFTSPVTQPSQTSLPNIRTTLPLHTAVGVKCFRNFLTRALRLKTTLNQVLQPKILKM